MKTGIQILGIVAICFLWSCQTTQVIPSGTTYASSAVDFMQSDQFFAVLDKAEKEGKMVFVDFYADYCVPCKMMDKEVFTDKETARVLNRDFISFKVDGDGELGMKMRGIYSVYSYPTLLFMDSKGVVVERKEGAVFQTQLQQMARRALNKRDIYARVN